MVYIEAQNNFITRVRCIPTNDQEAYTKGTRLDNHPVIAQAKAELEAYFYYQNQEFTVPLDLAGSNFDKLVWATLLSIPYAHSASYADVAAAIGKPRAARAVGSACRRNPIWIIVPCHRIIGTDKKLKGYAGGLDKKQWLLNHEQCIIKREELDNQSSPIKAK